MDSSSRRLFFHKTSNHTRLNRNTRPACVCARVCPRTCVFLFIAAASKSHTSRISLPPFTASLFLDACCRLNALKCILENLGDNRARHTAPMLIIFMHPIQLTVRTCATREAARETCASLAARQVNFLHDIYVLYIYAHTHTLAYICKKHSVSQQQTTCGINIRCLAIVHATLSKCKICAKFMLPLSSHNNLCPHRLSLNSPGMTRAANHGRKRLFGTAPFWRHKGPPLTLSFRRHVAYFCPGPRQQTEGWRRRFLFSSRSLIANRDEKQRSEDGVWLLRLFLAKTSHSKLHLSVQSPPSVNAGEQRNPCE